MSGAGSTSTNVHRSPPRDLGDGIQDNRGQDVEEERGNLEPGDARDELQVRIPNGGFQGISVEVGVYFTLDGNPAERIPRAGSAVVDFHLFRPGQS